MRSINVQRATIGSGILEPVKCSGNMQLGINSTNHITIIEPKLPLLHQCVEPSSESTGSELDSTALFDVRSVFHIENLDSIGLQVFSKLLLRNGENNFNFGRIFEPLIVSHAWSPVNPSTRDCYLGVLLNTGEALILKRNTMDANNYSVQFRSFTSILETLSLPQNRLTSEGDMILTKDQFSELRLTNFSFGNMQNGSLIVIFAHENGDVTIHELSEGLKLMHRINTGGLVTKLSWSAQSSELFYALSDNSVHCYVFGPQMEILAGPHKLKHPSRFLISHMLYSPILGSLIVTDTKSIILTSKNSPLITVNLPYHSTIPNISTFENASKVSVLIPYESGNVYVVEIDVLSRRIGDIQTLAAWNSFCVDILHQYQVSLMKEQNKAASKSFQPYFADICETKLHIHGLLPFASSGLVAVVYSLAPANVISHSIKSRKEFNVGWLPSILTTTELDREIKCEASALSYLSSLIIRHKDQYPQITKEIKEGSESALQSFGDSLLTWKSSVFGDLATIDLSVESIPTLSGSLITNFRENRQIHYLQRYYIVNASLVKTLRAIVTNSGKPCDALNKCLVTIAQEQDIISSKIRTQLASIVVSWASKQPPSRLISSLDSFLLNTYSVVLTNSKIQSTVLPTPDNVKLIVSTDLCTEIFEISKEESITSAFLKSVVSSSKHSWPRCDMTLLPILDLTNKMDELESHNYLLMTSDESFILDTIFNCINYCVFTGTRLFELKVGV